MDTSTIILYSLLGVFGILGYLIKGKLESYDETMKSLSGRLEKHQDEDTAMHMKMVELYVTKVEYTNTIGRIFDTLTNMAEDIKKILSSKADRE